MCCNSFFSFSSGYQHDNNWSTKCAVYVFFFLVCLLAVVLRLFFQHTHAVLLSLSPPAVNYFASLKLKFLQRVLFFTRFSDFDGPQTLWLPSGEGGGNTPHKKQRQIVCLNENPPSAVNTLIRLMCMCNVDIFSTREFSLFTETRRGDKHCCCTNYVLNGVRSILLYKRIETSLSVWLELGRRLFYILLVLAVDYVI